MDQAKDPGVQEAMEDPVVDTGEVRYPCLILAVQPTTSVSNFNTRYRTQRPRTLGLLQLRPLLRLVNP
jgi:hypothetical protein